MPKLVGKYKIGKDLGEGSFGKVKLGVDTTTGEAFAIKMIDKRKVQILQMGPQLKREITIMKKLNHPNVVAIKEVLASKQRIFLVVELIQGGELFDEIVRQQRFDEPTAQKYTRQLVRGIQYCHNQGVAHRDLKPENLLLDKLGNIKITDFGLSNVIQNESGKVRSNALFLSICQQYSTVVTFVY